MISAIVGALGALKGRCTAARRGQHWICGYGEEAPNAEPYRRRKIAAGERFMGFGHRVYKVRDPRADVLAAAAEQMFHTTCRLPVHALVCYQPVGDWTAHGFEQIGVGRIIRPQSVYTNTKARRWQGMDAQ